MSDEITEQEAEAILRDLQQKKENVQSFFRDIIKSDDTTKTGNLDSEELGRPRLPLRSYKELALFSRDVFNDIHWENYFKMMGEIATSTSLSKDGILIKLAVTSKKELADVTPKEKKKNRGWFRKSSNEGEAA